MAKTESTAINRLIELVHRTPIRISEPLDHVQTKPVAPIPPLVRDSDPTLFVEKPLSCMPSNRPVGVPPPAVGTPAVGTPVPAMLPAPPPIPVTPRTRAALSAAEVIREIRRQTSKPCAVSVHFDARTLLKILAMMVGAVIIGALCGRLVARGNPPKLQATAPPPVAAPVAAPGAPTTSTGSAPLVTNIETAQPQPQRVVTVDFVSQPSGANVTLVSHGAQIFVGTTPVMAQVDATILHDVVFTLDGYATKVAHLAPSTTEHVSVVLDALPAKEHVAARPSHSRHAAAKLAPADDESHDVVVVSDE
jgi:hypothetical protein